MQGVDDASESSGWELLPRLASGALAVPMVMGFVLLGAAVVAGRSLRGLAREAWTLVPWGHNGADNRNAPSGR